MINRYGEAGSEEIALQKYAHQDMREIKFRARSDNGQFVYGYLCPGSKDRWYIVTKNSTTDINPSTLGQFTGIYDCKGKEIYEGDKIRAYDRNWHVFFSEGCFVAKSGRHLRTLRNMYCEVIV
jgi:hypothetical protein